MQLTLVPILLFAAVAIALAAGMVFVGMVFGPKRNSAVKEMPYESGMDPIHDARRRFDVHFHLVAIAFLVFDVELLFLYPWAVANKAPEGIPRMEASYEAVSQRLIFGEAMFFVGLLTLGLVYAWRRGIFRWR